jgi:hypothetical protein
MLKSRVNLVLTPEFDNRKIDEANEAFVCAGVGCTFNLFILLYFCFCKGKNTF